MTPGEQGRRLPVGAEVLSESGVHFRVWVPHCRKVTVVLEIPGTKATALELAPEPGGYFSGWAASLQAGQRYRYRLDNDKNLYPDPASRFQPEGPHGPSQIVDPRSFPWSDSAWRGVQRTGQVIYEMHIGTFTSEGTWTAALRELPELAALGITVLEVMPIADFPGRFGWGYDGVNLFAPTRLYGEPDDFRRFVDRAHSLGMGVILDVVYNHLGPDGNYLGQFAPDYFTDRYQTDWGKAINFDGDNAGPVREYFLANAGYWIDEYHLDGLRLDATQNIYDASSDHILAAIGRRVPKVGRERSTFVVAENEPQHVKLVRPVEQGGYGLDALWNDDFHHTALVALTGHNEAYYSDYQGKPQELISAVKWGYLYQGQYYTWQHKNRGAPARGLPPTAFVNFLENHDQVANSARGLRPHLLSSPGRHRALTALLLLAPGTPMLFQGQEFSASSPFYYFADHNPELAQLVSKGRKEFLHQFPSVKDSALDPYLPDPGDAKTFERCKLDLSERQSHAPAYELHQDLLRLRREDPLFRAQRPGGVEGAVLGEQVFLLRFFGVDDEDRLLIINLGRDHCLAPAPEPLLAPPEDRIWELLWSSDYPRYGGCGTAPLAGEGSWRIPGESALVLRPKSRP